MWVVKSPSREHICEWIDEAVKRLPVEQQSEWRELSGRVDSFGCRFITEWTPEIKDAVHAGLHDAVLSIGSAFNILRVVSNWEPLLGAWLACQVARLTLWKIPADESAPREAVIASEECLLGQRSIVGLSILSERALDASRRGKAVGDPSAPAASVAHYACTATEHALTPDPNPPGSMPFLSNRLRTGPWASKTENATSDTASLPPFLAKELRRGLEAVEEGILRRSRTSEDPYFAPVAKAVELIVDDEFEEDPENYLYI